MKEDVTPPAAGGAGTRKLRVPKLDVATMDSEKAVTTECCDVVSKTVTRIAVANIIVDRRLCILLDWRFDELIISLLYGIPDSESVKCVSALCEEKLCDCVVVDGCCCRKGF